MTKYELLISISKRKHIGSFYLRIENDAELSGMRVSEFPKNGIIDKNVAYGVREAIEKIITGVKEKLKTPALNWRIDFLKESYVEERFGSRERVCKISEEEIDTVFEALRGM